MKLMRAFAVLAFVGAMACSGSMANVAKSGACNASCDTAKNECVDKCAGDKDSAACELACDAARQKCAEDCKKS